MRYKYILREEALENLREIGRYTLKNHGKKQKDIYLRGIENCFNHLSENPFWGRRRDQIKKNYYSYDYKKHVIFYLVNDNAIEILAILHQSMIPQLYL